MSKSTAFKLLMLLIILSIGWLFIIKNSKRSRVLNLTNNLNIVNSIILEHNLNHRFILDSLLKSRSRELIILQEAVTYTDLCEIRHYPKTAIAYKFQCADNSFDHFIDSNDKYYLFKIINGRTDFLTFEQFADYSKPPVTLGDDWYFIEQNITYD